MQVTIVFLLCALSMAQGFLHRSPVDCDSDPVQMNSGICSLIPEGCLIPVCGVDVTNQATWFRSACHLFLFNIQCRTKYRVSPSDVCLPEIQPPVSSVPCPFPFLFRPIRN